MPLKKTEKILNDRKEKQHKDYLDVLYKEN